VGFVCIREQQEFENGYVANESSIYSVPYYLPSSIGFLLALLAVLLSKSEGYALCVVHS